MIETVDPQLLKWLEDNQSSFRTRYQGITAGKENVGYAGKFVAEIVYDPNGAPYAEAAGETRQEAVIFAISIAKKAAKPVGAAGTKALEVELQERVAMLESELAKLRSRKPAPEPETTSDAPGLVVSEIDEIPEPETTDKPGPLVGDPLIQQPVATRRRRA